MKYTYVLHLAILLFGGSCKPFDPTPGIDEKPVGDKNINELSVPEGFLFKTTESISLRITAVDNRHSVLVHIPFRVLLQTESNETPVLLFSGQTDDKGVFETRWDLPATAQYLFVETDFPGLPPVSVACKGQSILQITLGENNQADGRAGHATENPMQFPSNGADDRSTFAYLGTYDSQGVPNYLMLQGDAVSQDILNMIAASLPESQPVPTYHPEYIASEVQTNTVLTDSADIWVTFVHEGAGYRNALGYYTYPSGQTPQTAAAVGDLRVVFPNVSFSGSGGGLHTGDKVYLGRFYTGTTLGWFVVPDGWQSATQNVSDANHAIHYSDKQLNTFTQEQYRNHVVQLVDPNRELLLLGFEDIDRPGGDNDFNDAIFYVTVTPFVALQREGLAETNISGNDADGDGVPDDTDEAPNNPDWAFKTFTPSANQMGTLAFEDFFPAKGDYDMNDLVLDYRIEEHTNAAGKVVEMKANFLLRAMGAGFRNGFGFELPVPWDQVVAVSGTQHSENYVQLNPNGTENGQQNAVVVVFDNGYHLMSNPGGGGFVNTETDRTAVAPVPLEVLVTFSTPISRAILGAAPYNPFLIVNQQRGREIHLPGKMPTQLADTALFGTFDDGTNFATGQTYQTANKLPWALHLPVAFAYPSEKNPINTAFLKFNQWVESGGSTFPNWYGNDAGYRDTSKIY